MKINKYLWVLLISALTFGQNQKYTMAEAVNGLRSNLAVKNISQFSWAKDGKTFIQGTKNGYLVTEVQSMKEDTLVTLKNINAVLTSGKQLKTMPNITFLGDKGFFRSGNQYFKLEKSGKTWKIGEWLQVPEGAENIQPFYEDNAVAFTVKNNLFWQKDGKTYQVTSDENENIVNGQSVHRNEFGINGGIFVSPDKNKIAFYRMDQTMVNDYPVINWTESPAKNTDIKYPVAGGTSHQVTLGVFDPKTQQTTFLKTEGPKDQYLTAITWSPDSKTIFVGILNREQNHMKLNQYDASTGNFVKTIFEETDSKYVEPQHALSFLPKSNKDFLWQSQRSGFNHLYLYNTEKGLIKQLTKGDWLVTDILGFNAKRKEVYFSSTKETPLEKHLYRVNWNSGKIQRLDRAAGNHSGVLTEDGNYLYDVYSNAATPRTIELINTQTLKVKNILTAENPLKNYDRPEIKNITLKADDGTPLYGKLILPTNFNPAQKYPVIVYLYNGPHLQLVTNSFPASGNLWYEYMAQRGYIIFTMDGRGSSNRGLKFEQAVFRDVGTVEMSDQLKGVSYLKSIPYVDDQRMGVHGWSYGGFMTTSLMLKHPDVFKAGVAGGPVIDWSMYEVMYTERYMDTPQENPQGYANANLLDKVQNLKGKLLMIHGTDDDVVVWQHSLNFLKAAVDKGVQLDYFVYPGHQHNVVGKDRVHLMQKVTDYFDLHLK